MNSLLTSCVQEPEAPRLEPNASDQLAKVKSWFEENKTKLRLPERGSNFRTESQELILPFFEKEPDWDKFHHYYFPDGREVFEMNLENAQTFLPSSEFEAFDQEAAQRIIQNILFIKHPSENRFDPLIVRYYPDEETSTREFDEINYQMIDENWSGTVDLFTYDEHYFVGFEIHEGQIIATRHMEAIPDQNRKLPGIENKDVRCAVTTTDWYQISYVRETNTWVVQQLSPTHSYSCGMGSYDSGGPPSAGTYSYGGGFTSDGNGDGPYSTGGATDGDGTCSSCEYDPPSVPRPGIKNNLTNPCASDVFKQVKRTGIQSENQTGNFKIDQDILKLFEESIKYDYIIQNSNNPNRTTRNFNRSSGKSEFIVNLNDDYLSKATQLSIARTIIHESLHAYISYQIAEDLNYRFDFEKNYIDYIKKGKPHQIERAHHEFMAEYIEAMAYSLKQWDRVYGNGKVGKPLLDDDYYRAMAFGGLFKDRTNTPTDSFKALVPSDSDRVKILKIIQNEQEGTNSKGTKCN